MNETMSMANHFQQYLSATSVGCFRLLCASSASLTQLQDGLRGQGFKIYTLRSSGVIDKTSLLEAIVEGFQLEDYPKGTWTSWDAVSDSLWQAIMGRTDERVALLWNDAHKMVLDRLQLFLDCLEIFHALGDTLERQEVRADCRPVLFRIVALGEGPSFPLIDL